MKCPSCGRECQDEANYCYYCGYSFRDEKFNEGKENEAPIGGATGHMPIPMIDLNQYAQLNTGEKTEDGKERVLLVKKKAPLKTWQWVLYFATLVFPYTSFIWLGVTGYWAVSPVIPDERKNFARGMMIFLLALFTIAIMFMLVLIQNGGLDSYISEMTGGKATSAEAYLDMISGR